MCLKGGSGGWRVLQARQGRTEASGASRSVAGRPGVRGCAALSPGPAHPHAGAADPKVNKQRLAGSLLRSGSVAGLGLPGHGAPRGLRGPRRLGAGGGAMDPEGSQSPCTPASLTTLLPSIIPRSRRHPAIAVPPCHHHYHHAPQPPSPRPHHLHQALITTTITTPPPPLSSPLTAMATQALLRNKTRLLSPPVFQATFLLPKYYHCDHVFFCLNLPSFFPFFARSPSLPSSRPSLFVAPSLLP